MLVQLLSLVTYAGFLKAVHEPALALDIGRENYLCLRTNVLQDQLGLKYL